MLLQPSGFGLTFQLSAAELALHVRGDPARVHQNPEQAKGGAHVVDLKSEFVLSAVVYPADHGDPDTLADSVMQAAMNLDAAGSEVAIAEVVADKGYHKAATLALCQTPHLGTYIPERKRRHRSRWTDKPAAFQHAVYANRRRVRGVRSKPLQRLHSERVERRLDSKRGSAEAVRWPPV